MDRTRPHGTRRERTFEYMKTVIIIGENNLMTSAADLLNPKEMKLVGFGDTREMAWNVFDAEGNIRDDFTTLPVMPVEMVASFEPDCVLVATLDRERNEVFKYLLYRSNFFGEVIFLYDLADQFSIRTSALRRLTGRLGELGIEGAVAEVGCSSGDTSWQLNALMPGRRLYLFDTFSGFDARDIAIEKERSFSEAGEGGMAYKDPNRLLSRMVAPDRVVLKKGWFPETAEVAADEKFALVYIDACLYNPTLAALTFFFPRMSRGGCIILTRYEDDAFNGVYQAAMDFEAKYGRLLMVPLGDPLGTVCIMSP